MSLLPKPDQQRIGLILTGGGARAAYQVGVLRAIATTLPKLAKNPFHVIAGTSAGALNAASLATHAHHLRTAVRTLETIWKNISSDMVYDLHSANLLSSASGLVLNMLSAKNSDNAVALLHNAPLAELLARVIKFNRIQHNIDIGLLDALSITASAYSSGESVSFYQAIKNIEDWQGPHRIGVRTQLGLEHLMASAAIPVIFPAVKLGAQYFGDGAIRQLAPTSTAMHLGARRLLAIGVSGNRTRSPLEDELTEQPSLSQILGHILNSAFVDALENDLEFIRHMNAVNPLVPKPVIERNSIHMNKIDLLEISPSRELNVLAMEHYHELPKTMTRYIKEGSSGTLLSLILFERGFCGALCQLGFEDGMEKEGRIRDFFAELN